MHPLQEKFQITVPAKEEKGEAWASAKSQRHLNGAEEGCEKFNFLPPGMEIENQERSRQDNMALSVAGESDVSADTNPDSFRDGFKKRTMKGSDDQYTGEHVDHFYGDAGGFAERNNYLDRE
jgi:hypothetical protein